MGCVRSSNWKFFRQNQWNEFPFATSQQIDEAIHSAWNTTQSQIITFPITEGSYYSDHPGVYFCRIRLTRSVKEGTLGNKETGTELPMKRDALLQLPQRKHKRNINKYRGANRTQNITKKYGIVNPWIYKHIDEWTCNELQEWIVSLNLRHNITKKIVQVISEERITGNDFNTMNEYSAIGDAFDIDHSVSFKIWNALMIIKAQCTNERSEQNNSDCKNELSDDIKDEVLLPLQDGNITISVDIYIPSIKSDAPVCKVKKIVSNNCPVDTLRYQVFQEVTSRGHMEVKDVHQVSIHYFQPSKKNPVTRWMCRCDEKENCSLLLGKSVFAIVNSANTEEVIIQTYNVFIDAGSIDEKQSYFELEVMKKGATKSFANKKKQCYPKKQIYIYETVGCGEYKVFTNTTAVCFWMTQKTKLKWNKYDMSNINPTVVIDISEHLNENEPNWEHIIEIVNMKINATKDKAKKMILSKAMVTYQALLQNQVQATNFVYKAFAGKFKCANIAESNHKNGVIKESEQPIIQSWKDKRMEHWTNKDVLDWLKSMNLEIEWNNKLLNVIQSNQCSGEDIIELKCAEDIGESFEVGDNEILCNKIYTEITNFKLIWKANDQLFTITLYCNNERIQLHKEVSKTYSIHKIKTLFKIQREINFDVKYIHLKYQREELIDNKTLEQCGIINENHLIEIELDDVFSVNIYAQGKNLVLNDKVTKDFRIEQIKKMYKQQSSVYANIEQFQFYKQKILLKSYQTLEQCGIIDEKHLIMVQFEAGGAWK